MKSFLLLFSIFFLLQNLEQETENYNKVSEQLLQNIIDDKNIDKEISILEKSTLKNLNSQLKTDQQKIAFWVNVYNAFIQIKLKENPELYQDRSDFFGKNQIKIAGEELSFDEIEHGILRRSKMKISLGYLGKLFPPKWEKELRVENIDWRIHFALNCGAKSCPPVAVYSVDKLNTQLDFMTERFLKKTTTYIEKENEASVTTLFSWFRADFGGISGVKEILKNYKITPIEPDDLDFKDYNWELYLDNFIAIPN